MMLDRTLNAIYSIIISIQSVKKLMHEKEIIIWANIKK